MAQASVGAVGQEAGRWRSWAVWGLASVVAWCLPACAQPWPEVVSRPGLPAPGASAPAWVAQLAAAQGGVWLYDRDQGAWLNAQRDQLHNWPVSSGDRLRTDPGARGTLRVGALTLRLDGDSDLELLRLDADQLAFRLWRGNLAVQVLDDAQARRTLLVGETARATPQRSGHYRLAVDGGKTVLTTWRGELRVTADTGAESGTEDPLLVTAGRELALWRDVATGGWRQVRRASQPDDFAEWALAEGRLDQAPLAAQHVSAEASGWQALDAHGQWRDDPQWGKLWVPRDVEPGWAPYRDGRWAWVAPWGWTWIDTAPWGFATYHYGQWVAWRGGWAWVPTPRQQRPVFRTVQPGWNGPPPRSDRPVQPPPRVDRPAQPVPWAGHERPAEPPPNKTLPANPWPRAPGPAGRGAPAPLIPETPRPAPPAAEVPDMPTPRVPGVPRRGYEAPSSGMPPAPAKPSVPVTSPTPVAPVGPVAPVRPVMPPPAANPPRPETPRAPDAPPKAAEPPAARSDNKAEQPNKSWR